MERVCEIFMKNTPCAEYWVCLIPESGGVNSSKFLLVSKGRKSRISIQFEYTFPARDVCMNKSSKMRNKNDEKAERRSKERTGMRVGEGRGKIYTYLFPLYYPFPPYTYNYHTLPTHNYSIHPSNPSNSTHPSIHLLRYPTHPPQ
jgi:hypothetical protein